MLRENLVKAVKELEGSAIGDPLEVAEMQETLGWSLVGLGEYDLAVEVLEKAWATLKSKLGPDHPDTLTSMNYLAFGLPGRREARQGPAAPEETLPLTQVQARPRPPPTPSPA